MAENVIGYIQFYGFTPCINFFKECNIDIEADDRDLNFLVSETCDLRHILKSISDIVPMKKSRKHKLNIWIHEKEFGCLARDLLFLTIICETSLSKRERMELFIDLYSNCLIRDKTDQYMQGVLNELIQLVTEDSRCPSVLRNYVHMDSLKFKERDELEDVISSYYNTHPFDIEKQHQQRVRYHLKERYDFRLNMFDWDYNMYVKTLAPYIHPREYKIWRNTGLAFEWRLTENKIPNRTFSSYIPGYHKKEKSKILVRGFWGDILQSPYVPFGLEIWKEPEAKQFFEKINYQLVYSCLDVSMYNVQYYIQKLEDMTEYNFPFERVKRIKESITGVSEGEEPKIEEVGPDGNPIVVEEMKSPEPKSMMEQLSKPGKTIDLSTTMEGEEGISNQDSGDRQWLQAFKHANVHLHLLAEPDIKTLKTKQKYRGLFDGGVLSIQSAAAIGEDLALLFKDKARVHCETADFLIALKPEQRVEFRKQVLKKVQEAGWENIYPHPFKHHFLLEVKNSTWGQELTNNSGADEEDFMDLSGL